MPGVDVTVASASGSSRSIAADGSTARAPITAAATTAGWAPVKVRLQSEAGEAVAGNVRVLGTAINALVMSATDHTSGSGSTEPTMTMATHA